MVGLSENSNNFPVPQTRHDNQQLLPTSAPVSSLLPPIPSHHNHLLQQHLQASIQAQLAALLTHGTQQQSTISPSFNLGFPATNPSNLLAAAAAVANTPTNGVIVPPNPHLSTVDMHGWSVEQIENHIALLRQLKQEIPQKVTLLLHDAKKRAEKRHAKRIANRQSACTSRARKKALVEEMTAINARLRRQALILSLLPDLVIVIDIEGKITFCSAQVERVLQHSIDDLVGAKLTDIIDPGSRDKMSVLIQGLLSSSQTDMTQSDTINRAVTDCQDRTIISEAHKASTDEQNASSKKSYSENDGENDDHTSGVVANVATETSFPLSVVQVDQADAAARSSLDENENSDASNSKQPSSLTANSIAGNSGSDDGAHKKSSSNIGNSKTLSKEDTSISQSSDSSNTSSNTVSSNNANLITANANLERNVRYHNKKIMKDKRAEYKDDVIGADVTANNASARLSSLQHLRSADSSEEDSGYRESNDSREETSSSSDGEVPSHRNGRRKPIAPTCNVCLIRNDLTTIWCEVTSSLRTKDCDDVSGESESVSVVKNPPESSCASADNVSNKLINEEADRNRSITHVGATKANPQVKEILLCLRPIRDGKSKTDEAHRFKPSLKQSRVVSEDNHSSETTSSGNVEMSTSAQQEVTNGKRQKRMYKDVASSSSKKKRENSTDDIDTVVVESLMSMSNQKA